MSELFNRLKKIERDKKGDVPISDAVPPAPPDADSAAAPEASPSSGEDGFPIEGEIVRQKEESRKRFKVGVIAGVVIFLVAILGIGIIGRRSRASKSKQYNSGIIPPRIQDKMPESASTLAQSKIASATPSEGKKAPEKAKTEEKGTKTVIAATSKEEKAKPGAGKTVEAVAPVAGAAEKSQPNVKEENKPKTLAQGKILIHVGNKGQTAAKEMPSPNPVIPESSNRVSAAGGQAVSAAPAPVPALVKPPIKEQVPPQKVVSDQNQNTKDVNFFEQAVSLYKGNNTAAAVESLKKGLHQNPQAAVGYNNLGVVYFQRGELNESLSQFTMAIQLNPLYAEAHYNLAVTLEQLGRNQTALYHYLKFIEMAPPQLKQLQEHVKAHVDIY